MIPKFTQSSEDVKLRKQYLDALRVLETVGAQSVEAETKRKELLEVEAELLEKGQKNFVEGIKVQKNAVQDFFGELGATKRGKALAVAKDLPKLFDNFTGAIKTDLFDAVTGLGKKKKDEGLEQNTFLSRLFGAEKFRADLDPLPESQPEPETQGPIEPPIAPSDESPTLLKLIESNTRELAAKFAEFIGDEESRAKARDRAAIEAARESKKSKLPVTSKSKDVPILGGGDGGIFDEVVGGIAGAGLGSLVGAKFGALLTKSMNVAKVAAGVGARALPVIGSILAVGFDAVAGFDFAEEWGVGKLSGVIGSVLGGTDEGLMGAFTGAGKWAMIGATAGSVVPVVGTLAGGLIGAAVGALLGWVGGERIAKFVSDAGTCFEDLSRRAREGVSDWVKSSVVKPFEDLVENLFGADFELGQDSILEETKTLLKKSAVKLYDQVKTWVVSSVDSILGLIGVDGLEDASFESVVSGLKTTLIGGVKTVFAGMFDVALGALGVDDLDSLREAASAKFAEFKNAAIDRVTAFFGEVLGVDFGPVTSIFTEMVPNAISNLTSKFTSVLGFDSDSIPSFDAGSIIDSAIPDFLESVGEFVRKIFTWDYWFGDDELSKNEQVVKKRIASVKAMEERRGRLTSELESSVTSKEGLAALEKFKSGEGSVDEVRAAVGDNSEALKSLTSFETFESNFGDSAELAKSFEEARSSFVARVKSSIDTWGIDSDDPAVVSLIEAFETGAVDLSGFKSGLSRIRADSGHSGSEEAAMALAEFGRHESLLADLRRVASERIEGPRAAGVALTEVNREDAQSAAALREAEAAGSGARIAAVVSNSTVNNNSSITIPPSAANDEPTFAGAVHGTTSTTHTGG